MVLKLNKLFYLPILAMALLNASSAISQEVVPPPRPYYYLLDESKLLDSQTQQALQVLLVEHDRFTGQQLMIGIFENTRGQRDDIWTKSVFSAWKVGKQTQGNGLLLALFPKLNKAQLEIGYGLESLISPEKAREILDKSVLPELSHKHLEKAVLLGTYKILETLDSPTLQNGRITDLLKKEQIQFIFNPDQDEPHIKGWTFLFLLGMILFIITLLEILSREAHFTESGWYRVAPFSLLFWKVFEKTKRQRQDQNTIHSLGGTHGSW